MDIDIKQEIEINDNKCALKGYHVSYLKRQLKIEFASDLEANLLVMPFTHSRIL